jgi:peptidyl-Asp metalloendopeptidase
MAQRRVRCPAKLLIVVLLTLILPATISAQRDREIELFVEPLNSRDAAATSGDRRLVRTRFVDVNLDLLASQVERVPGRSVEVQNIRLNLFEDTSFTAVPDRIESTGTGSFSWTGHLQGVEPSGVSLVVRDGVLAGNVSIPGTSYEVRYEGSGVYSINQIDPAAFPPEAPPIPVDTPSTLAPVAGDDGSIVDVMVVYTPTARQAAGGTNAMNALIALAVSESNTGYGNSNVTQRLRLVHTAEVEYSEAGFDWDTALIRLTNTSDGFMDEVHALRDTYGADAVVLIVNNSMTACGIGWLMTTVSDAFKTYAFSVVSRICAAGNYTFAHELGHNMGSHHDRANASGPAAYPYSYGYQAPDTAFRTIMAYNCEGLGCPRVNYWSNPEVFFGGQPMGVEHTLPNAADNRRSLNNTAFTVANWRNSAPAAAKAQITSPQPGSTLNSSTVTFTWNTGSGVSQYWLDVGTTLGGTQIYSQSQGTNLSATVSGLPANGSTVYVRLWSRISGVWQFNDYTYTASGGGGVKAAITSPIPGSTLTSSTVTFVWNTGAGVSEYWLEIGTNFAGDQLYSQSQGTNLSVTVSGLPVNGSTLYVRMWSKISGVWQFNDYVYIAATQ